MPLNEADVIAWLRELPDKKFFEVIYRASADRGPHPMDRAFSDAHFVAGFAIRHRQESDTWGSWQVELVGLPVDAATSEEDLPICQFGTHCGYGVTSWSKHSRCPVCGADAYGT
jgi:hypothetical protein